MRRKTVARLICVLIASLLVAPSMASDGSDGEEPPESVEQFMSRLFERESSQVSGRFTYRKAPHFSNLPGARPCPAQAGRPVPESSVDICDLGRALSQMEPCLRPEDCRALDMWSVEVGPPSMHRAIHRAIHRAEVPTSSLRTRMVWDPIVIDSTDSLSSDGDEPMPSSESHEDEP